MFKFESPELKLEKIDTLLFRATVAKRINLPSVFMSQ